ncbi:RnfABCDGE type electron transport complex subunit D [Candidatus Woesearchaeota archaeon]|nr:RnfABCDGE type electron transport complex subunit D [Candidatus Woesearchaeota archaeon]
MRLKEAWNWWWYDVRHPMGLLFFIYALVAGLDFGFAATLVPFLTAAITGGILDFFIDRYRNGYWGFPSSGLVTGSIIGLVMSHQSPLWLVMVVTLIAVLSKVIIQRKGYHPFNPANFGMLIGFYFLGSRSTWWGASNLWLVALGGLFVLWRQRKWWTAAPFLLVFFALRAATYAAAGDIAGFMPELLASSAVVFFATIMLIEPKTSPARKWPSVAYAITCAALAFGLSFIVKSGDFHLALALSNLSVLLWNRIFK